VSFREKRHANVKTAILLKCLDLIEKNGVERLSIRTLAEEIEYSPAALYEYFSGKVELLGEITHLGHEMLANYMRKALGEPLLSDRLLSLGSQYLLFAREHANLYHLMFNQNKDERTNLETQVPADSAYGILLGLLAEARKTQADKALGDTGALEDLAYAYWALVHGMATLEMNHLKGFHADFAQAQAGGIRSLLRGFGLL
jgi:AcrR family transcriptional regulator